MFQSQVICLDGSLDDVLNIRLNLKKYHPSKSIRKIARKVENRFQVSIQKMMLNEIKDKLYITHQKRFKGFQFKSLTQMLIGDSPVNLFDTYEINVYDGDELIAYSLFDLGKKGIASILGVFDERYKSYSLGIYTMYAEIKWAIQNGFDYYYPGYVIKNNPLFDYKLRLGEYEFFDWTTNAWKQKEEVIQLPTVGDSIKHKLFELTQALEQIKIKYEYKIYPYYSLGFLSMTNYQFYVKSPSHILLPSLSSNNRKVILEYDAEDNRYVLASTKISESYRDLLIENHATKDLPDYVWDNVMEYLSIHKYLHLEKLVHDIWLNN